MTVPYDPALRHALGVLEVVEYGGAYEAVHFLDDFSRFQLIRIALRLAQAVNTDRSLAELWPTTRPIHEWTAKEQEQHRRDLLAAFDEGDETCARGHVWDDETTRVRRDGRRECRKCEALRRRERAKQRAYERAQDTRRGPSPEGEAGVAPAPGNEEGVAA